MLDSCFDRGVDDVLCAEQLRVERLLGIVGSHQGDHREHTVHCGHGGIQRVAVVEVAADNAGSQSGHGLRPFR